MPDDQGLQLPDHLADLRVRPVPPPDNPLQNVQATVTMYAPNGAAEQVPRAHAFDYGKQGYTLTPKTEFEKSHEGGGAAAALKEMIPDAPKTADDAIKTITTIMSPGAAMLAHAIANAPANARAGAASAADVSPKDAISQVSAKVTGGTAGVLGPVVGMDPQAARAKAERGDTSGVLTQAAVPTAMALAGPAVQELKGLKVGEGLNPEAGAVDLSGKFQGLRVRPVENPETGEPGYHPKTLYHGTKAPIKEITQTDPLQYGDASALAGIGTYLTDSPEVASGYATGKKPGSVAPEGSRVLAGRLRADSKVLDLEKPASPGVRETFAKQIRSIFGDSKISDSQLDNDYFRAPGDAPDSAITGTGLFDGLRRAMVEAEYPKSEATEIMQNVATDLKHEHGVDVLRYEGGKRIPKYGPHEAFVVLPDMHTGSLPEGILKGEVPSKAARQTEVSQAGKSAVEENVPKEKLSAKSLIEGQGLVYKGELSPGSGVHMMEHPEHPGKTAALKESDLTPEKVQSKMRAKLEEFGVGKKAELSKEDKEKALAGLK